jgi:hypothetical protein
MLELYRERYFDLKVLHFHEKLRAEQQIELSYSWVKGVLQGAGLIARGRSAACIGSGDRGGLCPGCGCTPTGPVTVGFRMSVGMT